MSVILASAAQPVRRDLAVVGSPFTPEELSLRGVPAQPGLHPVPGYGVTVLDMTDDRIGLVESRVPQACTLPSVEQPLRLVQFDDMFRTDLRRVDRIDQCRVELGLRPEPAVAARAAELVSRETACCSFFTFTLTIGDGVLVLEVATPVAYSAVLESVAAHAEMAVGRPA